MNLQKCMALLAKAFGNAKSPAEVNKAMSKSFHKKAKEVSLALLYHGLLSNPVTHGANMAGSGLNLVWQIPNRFVSAGIARLHGAGGVGKNSVQFGEATQMVFGITESFGDALRMGYQAYIRGENSADLFEPLGKNTVSKDGWGKLTKEWGKNIGSFYKSPSLAEIPDNSTYISKYHQRSESGFSSRNLGFEKADMNGDPTQQMMFMWNKTVDLLGMVMSGVSSRALLSQDEFFSVLSRGAQMRALALRDGVKKGLEGQDLRDFMARTLDSPTAEMYADAQDFARKITFTAPLGDFGRGVTKSLNTAWPLKVAVPFTNAPANLLKQSFKATPLGVLQKDLVDNVRKGGPEGDLALAQIATGSGLSYYFSTLAWDGHVTGYGPTDPDLRRTWLETHQPYSIKIGSEWYRYDRFDPFGMFLGAAASYAEVYAHMDEQDAEELALALAVATSKSVLSKTWLTGPSELMETIMDPEANLSNWVAKNTGSLLIPAGVSQVARMMDPEWKEVNSIKDAIYARTPGYGDLVPPSRNYWGQKRLHEGALGPDIISPIYKYGVKDRPIDTWLYENKVVIRKPSRTRNVVPGGAGVEMDDWEYDRFLELFGTEVKEPATGMNLYDTLNAFVTGKHPNQVVWDGATDGPEGSRAAIVKQYQSTFSSMAWEVLMDERTELRDRVERRIKQHVRGYTTPIMNPTEGVEADYAPRINR